MVGFTISQMPRNCIRVASKCCIALRRILRGHSLYRITVLCFYGTHVLITRTQNFTTSQAIHVQRRHHSGANRGMNILSWLCSSAIAFESVMWQDAGVSITDISFRLCLSFAFLPHWFNKFPIVLVHAFIFSGPAAFTQTRRIQIAFLAMT